MEKDAGYSHLNRGSAITVVDLPGPEVFLELGNEMFEERIETARLSPALVKLYKEYHIYNTLVSSSSIHKYKRIQKVLMAIKSQGKKEIKVKHKSIGQPTFEEQRNQFIWDNLVKLNGDQKTEIADPVATEIAISKRKGSAVQDTWSSDSNSKKNFLDFYKSSHRIKDVKVYVNHQRPERVKSILKMR